MLRGLPFLLPATFPTHVTQATNQPTSGRTWAPSQRTAPPPFRALLKESGKRGGLARHSSVSIFLLAPAAGATRCRRRRRPHLQCRHRDTETSGRSHTHVPVRPGGTRTSTQCSRDPTSRKPLCPQNTRQTGSTNLHSLGQVSEDAPPCRRGDFLRPAAGTLTLHQGGQGLSTRAPPGLPHRRLVVGHGGHQCGRTESRPP